MDADVEAILELFDFRLHFLEICVPWLQSMAHELHRTAPVHEVMTLMVVKIRHDAQAHTSCRLDNQMDLQPPTEGKSR